MAGSNCVASRGPWQSRDNRKAGSRMPCRLPLLHRALVSSLVLLFATPIIALLGVAPAVADVHPFEVQEYQHAMGVSAEQAEENLKLQQRGSGIVEQLETALGPGYAGVWFDDEAGEFVVPMTSERARHAVDEKFVAAHLAGAYRAHIVEYSWEELEAAQEQIDSKLRKSFELNLVQTSLDPRTNAVVVYVASSASKDDRAGLMGIARSAAVQVELRNSGIDQFQVVPSACNTKLANCSRPLRGGVEIGVHNAPYGICTAGFLAIGNTNQSRYLISAGHCAAEKDPSNPIINWDAWDEQQLPYDGEAHYLGQLEQYAFPTHDWMKINVTGSWWDTVPWPNQVAYWGEFLAPPAIAEEYPINGEASSYLNQGVCHSGIGSGGSCGQVTALNVTTNFGETDGPLTYGLTKVKGACDSEGDSGGPWFAMNIAYGIHIGSDSKFGGCNNHLYYSEITKADEALGVHIASVPPPPGQPPTVATGDAPERTETETTITGTVNPNSLQTSFHFEYGTTTGYGMSIPVPDEGAGSGSGQVVVSKRLANLQPNSHYHYRLVATNSAGTSFGSDRTFNTGVKWLVRNSNSGGGADAAFWYGLPGEILVTGDWDGNGTKTPGSYNPNTGVWKLRNSNTTGKGEIEFQYGGGEGRPVVGDWDGNGTDTIGIYYPGPGNWNLRNSNSAGGANISFQYGGGPWIDGVAGDWDGNGTDTIGVYDPQAGNWNLRNSNSSGGADYAFQYGGGVWKDPITGDWDGNGTDTIGVHDPQAGNWNLRNSNSRAIPDISFQFGGSQFGTVISDWDNNGTDTIGLTDSNATTEHNWLLRNSNSSGVSELGYVFGSPGEMPVIGDWNGDGIKTLGLFQPGTGMWKLSNSNSGGGPYIEFQYGGSAGRPVVGDWDGNGTDTIGIYYPGSGNWDLRNSNSAGIPSTSFQYGGGPWIDGVAGNWDGNGTDTIGVYDPQAGNWNLRNSNSSGAPDYAFQYGGGVWKDPITGDWDGNGTDTIGVYDPQAGNWNLRNSNSSGRGRLRLPVRRLPVHASGRGLGRQRHCDHRPRCRQRRIHLPPPATPDKRRSSDRHRSK